MTSQPTITGELRKWQRKGDYVIGLMYNDRNQIWSDGDEAAIRLKEWKETPNYFLAVTNTTAIKCYKDEELKVETKN